MFYGPAVERFARAKIDDLILYLFDEIIDQPDRTITLRLMGSYSSARDRQVLLLAPEPQVRLAMVTGAAARQPALPLGER